MLGSALVGRSRWSVLRRAANFSLSWVILLTFGRQKGYHTITTGRLQISTRARHERGASSQTFCVAGVFPLWHLVRPSQDGERGERLTNTLFGAKNRADWTGTNRECWFGAKCYIMSQAPSTQEPRKLDGKRKALTPQTQACT